MHDYSACKWFIIVLDGNTWLRFMRRSLFRSVAIPGRQWSTGEDNWSLQFVVNTASSRSRTKAAHPREHRGSNPCFVSSVCGAATKCDCICTSMLVPLKASGDLLVTPHNRHRYYGAKISPEQRLRSCLCFVSLWQSRRPRPNTQLSKKYLDFHFSICFFFLCVQNQLLLKADVW